MRRSGTRVRNIVSLRDGDYPRERQAASLPPRGRIQVIRLGGYERAGGTANKTKAHFEPKLPSQQAEMSSETMALRFRALN